MRSVCCAARSMSRYETMPTFRPLFDHSCLSVLALSFKNQNKDLHRSELRLPLLQDRDTKITYYENVVEVGSLVG